MWTYKCKSRWYIPLPTCPTGNCQYRSLHTAAATLTPAHTHTCRFTERLLGHSNALRGHRNCLLIRPAWYVSSDGTWFHSLWKVSNCNRCAPQLPYLGTTVNEDCRIAIPRLECESASDTYIEFVSLIGSLLYMEISASYGRLRRNLICAGRRDGLTVSCRVAHTADQCVRKMFMFKKVGSFLILLQKNIIQTTRN